MDEMGGYVMDIGGRWAGYGRDVGGIWAGNVRVRREVYGEGCGEGYGEGYWGGISGCVGCGGRGMGGI